MDNVRKRVAAWYEGKFRTYDNEPGSRVFILGYWYERHWTSKVAHVLAEFWLEHWKYIITTALAVCGLIIALKKLS